MPLLTRTVPLALAAFRMWRRLPASQRRRVLVLAGRHGPRVAAAIVRRRRPFR